MAGIHGQIIEYDMQDVSDDEEDHSIPADPTVRNFSFALVDGKVYFRENSRMNPVELTVTAEGRVKGMIAIRDCVRQLIEYQAEDYPDSMIEAEQEKLNTLYDEFEKKYGRINSRANNSAFRDDSSYYLLTSLEVTDDEGKFIRKADMFTKRTIRKKVIVTTVDTASEALALSLAEKAGIDMPYMQSLTGKTEEQLAEDLRGVIFLNPENISENDNHPKYLPADEYLSGNVREKLALARRTAELYPEDYAPNVTALEQVQPQDLTASEISVRLGATWLPEDVVADFMFEQLSTPRYARWNINDATQKGDPIMDDKRAMTWQEFVDSDFDGRAYEFPDFEGTCFATIACKRWNKSRNLLVYLDLDDGRKLLTAAWNTTDFYGLADMPVGTRVKVTFRIAASGKAFLREAVQL